MSWISVNQNEDLTRLDNLVCWDDTDVVELYGSPRYEDFFPDDINRPGGYALNYYLLCRVASADVKFVELGLIHCDWMSSSFLSQPYFQGHVDLLSRTEILDYQQTTRMRCARLVYRIHGPEAGVQPGYLARCFASQTPYDE